MTRLAHLLGLTAAVLLTLALAPRVALAARTVPKSGAAPSPTTRPAPSTASPYDRALAKYRAGIDKAVAARRARASLFLRKQYMDGALAVDAELAENGDRVLDELRARAGTSRTGKLSFDGEVPENRLLRAGSTESAKVFATLLTEERVAPTDLVGHLLRSSEPLAGGWIPVLQQLAEGSDKECREGAVEVLYRAGVSRERFRPLLEELALSGGSLVALETLLFTRDPSTGLLCSDGSPANSAIFGRASAPGSSPELRAACANWAAEMGDLATAERICTELMWVPYKGRGTETQEPDDDSLYLARTRAMSVLYFKVRTDTAFKQVYDRAHIIWTEQYEPETLPADFREFSDNMSAILEIDYAKGLIGEL